jgi:hypothetical protein
MHDERQHPIPAAGENQESEAMVMTEGVSEDAGEVSQEKEMKEDLELSKEVSSLGEVTAQIQVFSSGATLEDDLDTFMKCRGVDVPGGRGGGSELGNGAAYTIPEITVSCSNPPACFCIVPPPRAHTE